MPSPRKRKLRKYNSNRKSAVRAKAAREGTPGTAPAAPPVVEEVTPVVEAVVDKPKKARKKKSLWSKKTSE